MKEYAMADSLTERRTEARKQVDQFYNVELFGEGIDGTHRLIVWNRSTKSMCLLVKENSVVLSRIKVGDTLKMLYYSPHSAFPCVYIGAVIRHITRKNQGRLNGNYLVGLETLKREDKAIAN